MAHTARKRNTGRETNPHRARKRYTPLGDGWLGRTVRENVWKWGREREISPSHNSFCFGIIFFLQQFVIFAWLTFQIITFIWLMFWQMPTKNFIVLDIGTHCTESLTATWYPKFTVESMQIYIQDRKTRGDKETVREREKGCGAGRQTERVTKPMTTMWLIKPFSWCHMFEVDV